MFLITIPQKKTRFVTAGAAMVGVCQSSPEAKGTTLRGEALSAMSMSNLSARALSSKLAHQNISQE
jgi:hypothetical protein